MFRLIDVNNSDELELPELRKIISDHFWSEFVKCINNNLMYFILLMLILCNF